MFDLRVDARGLWRTTVLNMIRGAHVVLYSTNAEADRAFFRDVLDYPFVDAGHGWLIFALPPAELAIHPADASGAQDLFLMCDDIEAFIAQMAERGVACSDLQTERWGTITHLTLPGGAALGVYEPTHPSPLDPGTNRDT
jgi:catechol 2,3-dioxygenase-like lactoylglutathione lyase family enzyme